MNLTVELWIFVLVYNQWFYTRTPSSFSMLVASLLIHSWSAHCQTWLFHAWHNIVPGGKKEFWISLSKSNIFLKIFLWKYCGCQHFLSLIIGTKFQPKLTILIFGTKFAPKWYFLLTEKAKFAIEFCRFKLV